MNITVDRKIYSDTCISKTVYALSKDICCQRRINDDIETIEVESQSDTLTDDMTVKLFWQTLNDYKNREIIAIETKEIRILLYAKAFADCDNFDENID